MSDDYNEGDDVYLDPNDIVEVIDLDVNDNQGQDQEVEEGDGQGSGDEEMEMEEAAASFTPERDDSALVFQGHDNDAVICCALHPLTSDLAVTGGQDDKAIVWNPRTGSKLFECSGHTDTVNCVGFSADGTLVATVDMKGLVQVWAVPSGALVWFFDVEEAEWLEWHPVAPVLLAGTKDGQVWMWKVPSGDCKTFSSHGPGTSCGRVLPDGKHCCVGYEDGAVKIWDLKAGEATFNISGRDGHSGSVLCMDAKASGNLVMTGSDDMTAKIISAASGKVVTTFQCGGSSGQGETADSVEAVGLCPSNDFAATGSLSGCLEVWDLPSKSVRQRFEHPHGVVKLLWSASAPTFYTACLDGCVRQFDARSGQAVRTWQGHTAAILDLSLSRDESLVLTSSDDFTARVFSLAQQT